MGFLTRFLPSLMPGLGALANPWVLVILAVFAAGCFATGVKVEGWHRDSAEKVQTDAFAAGLKTFHAKQQANNDAISTTLNSERAKAAQDQADWRTWYERNKGNLFTVISGPSSSSETADASPSAHVPPIAGVRIICGTECVSGWHSALAQGLPGTYRTWRTDAVSGAPDSVEASDLVANAAENFAACNSIRGRLLAFQDWARLNNLTSIGVHK